MSTVNNDFLTKLVKQQLSKKSSNEDFRLLTEIGPQDVGPGSAARPASEFRREISDEDLNLSLIHI